MTDLRDPAAAERLAYEAPDEYLRRREFLQRTAMAAGLAATFAMTLDAETLVAEAARRQRRTRLPSPRNMPIDTFVVLMMENRSFDHYLGWMPKADGRQAGLTYVDDKGKRHSTHPLAPDYQGCGFNDPDHSWEGGRIEFNHGKMDGFVRGENDVYAIGYYGERDLPFIPAAAKAFTTFDRYFCSLLGPTLPNREYMHAAQSYGVKTNDLPPQAGYPNGFPDTTIFAALEKKGISGRYFFSDEPVAALWGPPGIARSSRVEEYYARAASGTLPAVSFVDPPFEGEGEGTSGDEHPHGDIRTGQAFMSDVVHAFLESPQWKRGALFIVYDEWGGFFDHVAPPHVPDIRGSRKLDKDFGQMGCRIPAVVVSPYARRGYVSHSTFAHESILKMIRYRYGIRPLTRRDAYTRNIARAFDWKSKPRLEPPDLPDPPNVVSRPCGGGGSASRRRRDDFAGFREYLERLGFHYRPADPSTIYREPHKVRSAHRSAR